MQLPATSLATPAGWEAVAEVLRVAELSDKPVFVHPGPTSALRCPAVVVGTGRRLRRPAAGGLVGLARLRRSSAVPAAEAGLRRGRGPRPVHHERLTARGGRVGAVDPDVFVDTSSYGAQGLDALTRALGIDALVLGSDRPYAEPLESLLGEAATRAMRVDNPYRALGRHPHSGHETAEQMEEVA